MCVCARAQVKNRWFAEIRRKDVPTRFGPLRSYLAELGLVAPERASQQQVESGTTGKGALSDPVEFVSGNVDASSALSLITPSADTCEGESAVILGKVHGEAGGESKGPDVTRSRIERSVSAIRAAHFPESDELRVAVVIGSNAYACAAWSRQPGGAASAAQDLSCRVKKELH